VAMDMRYIESRSLGLDLKLLIQTAWVVLQREGAY
jgi:lipopolysaccharide/colanic/teichoic acid biosynthesis glycosyltransferase